MFNSSQIGVHLDFLITGIIAILELNLGIRRKAIFENGTDGMSCKRVAVDPLEQRLSARPIFIIAIR